jgi:hypothetical protein
MRGRLGVIFGFAAISLATASPSVADSIIFSTGNPDGLMAMATQSGSGGQTQIEAADDFVLTQATSITGAQFTGLFVAGSGLSPFASNVVVEIYSVFPQNSDTGRTSGPPTFSTSLVPTRVNSPSDVSIAERSSSAGSLSFNASILNPSFTANNSVEPGGIHPKPGQTTGGSGPVTGQEVSISVTFSTPFQLAAGHYFIVPEVDLTNSGQFFWLSAAKPNPSFPSGQTDLQTWIRDDALDPDWLRVGTDIVGGTTPPTFNASFTLTGTSITSVPGPIVGAGLPGLLAGFGAMLAWYRKRRAASV